MKTACTNLRLAAEAEAPNRLLFDSSPDIKIEAAAGEGGAGVPKIELTAYTGGTMIPSGFYEPVIVDLAGVTARSASLPILRDHDRSKVVGHTVSVEISAQRIYATGLLSVANEYQAEIIAGAKNGFPWGVSVAGLIKKLERVEAGSKVKVNGRIFDGPVYVARETELHEITVAAIAADASTKIKVAATAAAGKEQVMNFAAWLKSKNLVEASLTAAELTTLRAEYDAGVAAGTIKAEAAPTPAPSPAPATPPANQPTTVEASLADLRAQHAAELRRIEAIGKIAGITPTLQAQAIEGGWTTERAELETLRATRPTSVPGGIVRGGQAPTNAVLEAALCQAAGLPGVEKAYDAPTLEAAHRLYRGAAGLQDVIMAAAQSNGYAGPQSLRASGSLADVLQAAMPAHGLQASFSTLSLPGILSNVANKFLLAGFMTVEQTWKLLARIKSVRDFKQITSYRLTGNMVYAEVGPTGELTHGTIGEESFNNQAKTYGRMFAITRQAIINDDLGALSEVPRQIGRGGALKLNSVFWTAFMDNASFFASGNSNYAEGSGTALGHAAFTQAEALFLNQVDPDGNPVSIMPAILLVPNALKATAEELMLSGEVRDTTASKKAGTTNIHKGKAQVAASSYLSNSSISGYSSLAWYLLASPEDMPVMEVAFLNGAQNPTVETAQADFNTLGIQMRGYHDFGCAKQHTEGGVKLKGEA